jgi:hypothetical protein
LLATKAAQPQCPWQRRDEGKKCKKTDYGWPTLNRWYEINCWYEMNVLVRGGLRQGRVGGGSNMIMVDVSIFEQLSPFQ